MRDYAGGEMVAAWTMHVLSETHDVVLMANQPPDWVKVDARFGTTLAQHPPRVVLPAWWAQAVVAGWPGGGKLMTMAVLMRQLLCIQKKYRPQLWISTYNEMWMPKAGWEYIHYPWPLEAQATPKDWPRWRAFFYDMQCWVVGWVGLDAVVRSTGHRALANSRWTAGEIMRISGRRAEVVYPPVPPYAAGLPWAERENRVVILGRWCESKRLRLAMEIVARAREAGAELTLECVGFWDYTDMKAREELEIYAAQFPWITWHENLVRAEIEKLAGRSRYGLHAMEDEHFGIAVAELATAGCVVLVPASGGPREIVEDEWQVYRDAEEGAAKLSEIWKSVPLQTALHETARERGLRFRPEVFCEKLRGLFAASAAEERGA
jgi:glycosyltransferase involved in cell wall biosynthesis